MFLIITALLTLAVMVIEYAILSIAWNFFIETKDGNEKEEK